MLKSSHLNVFPERDNSNLKLVNTIGDMTENEADLQRMDSASGLLDVATAASLYLSEDANVLPPPDQYPPVEILSAQDLTEEDKKLAAALVAVQLVQQQKQQQLLLHDSANVSRNSLLNIDSDGMDKIMNVTSNDLTESTQSLMISQVNKNNLNNSSLTPNYHNSTSNGSILNVNNRLNTTSSVSSDNLIRSQRNHGISRKNSSNRSSKTSKKSSSKDVNNSSGQTSGKDSVLPSAQQYFIKQEVDLDIIVKSEEEDYSDGDLVNNTPDMKMGTRKSLPHKKRISRKLRTTTTSIQKLPSKTAKVQQQAVKHNQINYSCSKCGQKILHSDSNNATQNRSNQINLTKNVMKFSCEICMKMFDNQLIFYHHLKEHYEPVNNTQINSNLEMNEFSEPEDLMEGIRVVVDNNGDGESQSMHVQSANGLLNVSNNQHHHLTASQQVMHQETGTGPPHSTSQVHLDSIVSLRNSTATHTIITNSANIIAVNDSKVWYREDDELHATEADLQELEAEQLNEEQHIQLENTITSYICHMCGSIFDQRLYLTQHLAECYLVLKQEAELFNSAGVVDSLNEEDIIDIKETAIEDSGGNNNGENNSLLVKKNRKKKEHLRCQICDRVFNHRNSLVYHLRSHSGNRPHQCEQCGKSFFATSALKVHMRLHSGDKPYKCDYCGRHFRQWGDLKYHCVSIHSNQRQYQCEYCGKDFARKYSLVVHRRIHTGEKNYQCEYCKKTFRASSYLQNHRKIHTGEKPHPCTICGKPFRVRSDMKRHMNTHNRDRLHQKSSTNIKQNGSSDNDQAENNVDSASVDSSSSSTSKNIKEITPIESVVVIPKIEPSQLKTDSQDQQQQQQQEQQQQILRTPKEEELSGTLYTVPGDPLAIREGNNTVYVWPVYMT